MGTRHFFISFFLNFFLGGVAGCGGGGGALVGTRLQYPPVDRRLRFKVRNCIQSIFLLFSVIFVWTTYLWVCPVFFFNFFLFAGSGGTRGCISVWDTTGSTWSLVTRFFFGCKKSHKIYVYACSKHLSLVRRAHIYIYMYMYILFCIRR